MNSNNKYIIYVSIHFTIIYFICRSMFETLNFQGWLGYTLISSIFSAVVFYLLTKKESLGIMTGLIFIGIAVMGNILLLKNTENEGLGNRNELLGLWETKKNEEVDINLHFLIDSAVLIVDEDIRKTSYTFRKNKLKIFDEEEDIFFEWDVKVLSNNKLIISNSNDDLEFIKLK